MINNPTEGSEEQDVLNFSLNNAIFIYVLGFYKLSQIKSPRKLGNNLISLIQNVLK